MISALRSNRFCLCLMALTFGWFAVDSFADSPVQLADINKIEAISPSGTGAPLAGAQSGSKFFFTNETITEGVELWVTDGTSGGTHLVKDINPGSASSFPRFLSPSLIGGQDGVFFAATTVQEGTELWVSDGTAVGTHLVKDIYPGPDSSVPTMIQTGSGAAVFAASDPSAGRELWLSDGTSAGTNIIFDVNPGSAGSNPSGVFFNGKAIAWSAYDPTNGTEPWIYVPSAVDPRIIMDINPGTASSNPGGFTVINSADKLAFYATNAANGTEVWTTDLNTTTILKDIAPGADSSNPIGLTTLDNSTLTFFTRSTANNFDGLTLPAFQLWKSDGTNTTLVKDFGNVVPSSPLLMPIVSPFHDLFGLAINPIAVSNGKLYFFAADTEDRKTDLYSIFQGELWVSDGTTLGTKLVRDVLPGPGGSLSLNIQPINNSVVVPLNNGSQGEELWVSQGTQQTTSLLTDLNPGLASSITNSSLLGSGFGGFGNVAGGKTGLLARCVVGNQNKIAFTDGTPANTRTILNIGDSTRNIGSGAEFEVAVGQKALFLADNGVIGLELYSSDGTPSDTALLKDINPSDSSSPAFFQRFQDGSKAIFSAFTPDSGNEPWVTDGTPAGTFLLLDIHPGKLGSLPFSMGVELNGKIFFGTANGATAPDLWVTDGTPSGTTFLKNVAIASDTSGPISAARVGNKVFFKASDSAGAELWVSDGTTAGTKMVIDLNAGSADSSPSNITALGNKVIFSATTASGTELWQSDGTVAGTGIVKDINLGPGSSNISSMVAVNNLIYFSADDGVNGPELWITDGTPTGTKMLKDIYPGPNGSNVLKIQSLGNQVIFDADDGSHGREVWVSSGTPESTVLLKDINPGANPSSPTLFFHFPGTNLVFFSASEPVNGQAIWQTDGTTAGTSLAAAISPQDRFVAANGKLFFGAQSGSTGKEPCALLVDSCPNDDSKLLPGVCGCGISDSLDANTNGIPDCLVTNDLKTQLNALQKLLGKLKPAKNKAQLKALKANKKLAAALLKDITNITKANNSVIQIKGKVTLAKGSAALKSSVNQALKLKSTLTIDVKRAKKSLSALLKSIV